MRAVKFLERALVIRIFGVCLILAPFINIAFNIFLQSQKSKVTSAIVWQSLTVGTFSQNMQNLLSISSVFIGGIMLLGQRRAWNFVLGLIGFHIIIQTTTLLKDLKESWVWGGIFLVNLAVFFFIADQLVFKEKVPEDQNEKPTEKDRVLQQKDEVVPSAAITDKNLPPLGAEKTLSVSANKENILDDKEITEVPDSYTGLITKKRIFIHFTDLKMWAQLLLISNEGLLVKSMEPGPIDFTQKPMVVFLKTDLKLVLFLNHIRGEEYFFKFAPMTPIEIGHLNQWILEKSEVKRAPLEGNFNSLSFNKKVS
jgi:hypothetical protein